MNKNFLLTPFFPLINLFIITFFFLVKKALCVDSQYLACNPKTCGDGQNISYPFYIQNEQEPFCGYPGFELVCNGNGKPILKLHDNDYIIRQISYDNHFFRVSNQAVFNTKTTCIPPIHNISLPVDRFQLFPNQTNLFFLYHCNWTQLENVSELSKYKVDCFGESEAGQTLAIFEDNPLLGNLSKMCGNRVVAPVDGKRGENGGIEGMLEKGFVLNWTASNCSVCEKSGGMCGFDYSEYQFRCFCTDRPHALHCTPGNKKLALGLGLGLGVGGFALIIALISVLIFYRCYKRRHAAPQYLSTNSYSDPSSKRDLEGGGVYFGVPIFPYSALEEATNSFDTKKELGDGGFGTVYHGKLQDGREVAVKRLYEHNCKRLEQFMNEIEILTRLRHKNLVTLYGCTSRRSRELLLVYEYIPNGTVADHLHGDQPKSSLLTWPIRMSIATETASALAYLHSSDIIHRDVKTNNILLDNNFCVKVADFGLSRLFPNDVTHISTAPQGTPGYVDPEYHQCYQLTDKSDVYSFGVVLIELISSMPAVDISRHRDEINLANLAINKIQKCEFDELIDPWLGYNSNKEVKRMTTSVAELAFRCLQQNKEVRPSMAEVFEELKKIGIDENKENQGDIHHDNEVLKDILPPPSPQDDEAALLKNIRLLSSPDTVTAKWHSSCPSTPSVSG